VDAVSHLIFGRALAAIAPRPATASQAAATRGLTAATVIASIVPDADAVLMPFGWDRYLLWHQRGTHALIGTLADAIVFALLLRLLLPLFPRAQSPARLTHLMLAAWLGCLGHIVLDLISGGTIRLFAPFSTAAYGMPWMAMADPLIGVPLAIFLLASWRWRGSERGRIRRFAWIVLIVLAGVVAIKELSRRVAMHTYARETGVDFGGPFTAMESAWASFTRWFAFDRAELPDRLRVLEVDAWRGTVRLLFERELAPRLEPTSTSNTEALIRASTRLETVQHLHALFDLTFAEVRPTPVDGVVDVLWSDIRFCWPTNCALWFGGTFDSSTGSLREQVVLVGTLRQTRPP
jgi:membrane-bound metal-dependent hydrolase YbcI (DUF457 family)